MFQWPGVGVGAFSIGTWITVGISEASASSSAGPEFRGRLHRDAARSEAPRDRRIVHVVVSPLRSKRQPKLQP